MIIKGLKQINEYVEEVRLNNLEDWYLHHTTENYVRGTRRDVWARIKRHDAQKRRIAELEEELRRRDERESQARANYEMHMAMGCDDRDCRECR